MAIDKDFKNIKTNLSGALTDAKPAIEKLGNTIGNTVSNVANKFADIGSNFLDIGKMKRIKSTIKTVSNGVFSFEKNATPITTNPDGSVAPKDWRVSISVPSRIQEYMAGGSLLDPLARTNMRCVFPYTPTVLVSHSANYNAMQPLHTNYPYYAYENSRVDQITITADFFVQNEAEAQYWIAMVHFFKTVTKMNYGGNDPDRGLPPPVCRLNGYGDYTFNNVPVVISNFQFDLKKDVDYISTGLSAGGSNINDEVALTGKRGTAWAPSESLVTVGLMPQYSRTKQSEFNLKKFVKGEHTLPGKDGFI
tara:strand:- start:170 stop:1090 length:921 start_codon:yes stop_codon:yes gene_type:complete